MARNGFRRNYHTRCLKNGASDGVIEVVDTIWYWYYFIFDSRKYGIFRDHSMVCYWYNINILHTFGTTNVLGTQSYAQILPTLTICHFMQRKNVVGWDCNDLNQFRFANLYIRPFIRPFIKFYPHWQYAISCNGRIVVGWDCNDLNQVDRFPLAFSNWKAVTLK